MRARETKQGARPGRAGAAASGLGRAVERGLRSRLPLVAGRLYGVRPRDRGTSGAAAALLAVATLLAGWFPTRRARKIDPMASLRIE